MEKNEVSIHEVLVFREIVNAGTWVTNSYLYDALAGRVSDRTVRLHTKRLVDAGLVEQMETFPGHRLRITPKAAARNKGYLARLLRAADALGITDISLQ